MAEVYCGNYAFATAYAEFVNDYGSRRNYRIVKEVWDGETRLSREVETISLPDGASFKIHQNVTNVGNEVIFKAFRQDYATDGTYTETRVLNESITMPFCPLGPR